MNASSSEHRDTDFHGSTRIKNRKLLYPCESVKIRGRFCSTYNNPMPPTLIIGAGLAGSEAAWQCARQGIAVELFEMRPVRSTPAHQTADFAELVCSNSLKSDSENTAPWLLKEEMRRAGSLLLEIARACAVPAGHALAVDRVTFAAKVTEAISREPRIKVRREEVLEIEESGPAITVIASGP